MDKFKDSTGRWRTKSLFVETIQKDQLDAGFLPLYTLKGKGGMDDLHKMYIAIGDPTEYQFAEECLGGWAHLQHLRGLAWFKKHIDAWKDELEVKLRSDAIQEMRLAAKEGTRGISAQKYLAERGWEKKRGRPSKEEVERERAIQARMDEELHDDASRLLN